MFCSRASFLTVRSSSGGMNTRTKKSPPSSRVVMPSSRNSLPNTSSARSRVAASLKRTSTPLPCCLTVTYRIFSRRSSVRMLPACRSTALVIAASMSTSISTWIPPRRSRPRFIGRPLSAVSQSGMSGDSVSACVNSGGNALATTSCPFSWSSGAAKRICRRSVFSSEPFGAICARSRAAITFCRSVSPTCSPRVPVTSITGSCGKIFGKANSRPTSSTKATSRFFHSGYWFSMIRPDLVGGGRGTATSPGE